MAQPMSHAIIRWHVRHALLERKRAAAQARLAAAQTEAERVVAAEQACA
ncbi:MAG: hypothetical protein IVW57_17480 [Ktedonobacterales bacterium]|nr:hypothetical protein [Ktedonobacterales bacterium]